MEIAIRKEQPADTDAIARLTEAVFRNEQHSSHTEQFIVDALRRHHQLTVSLVALEDDIIVGHAAVSPVTISSGATGWYGLGPISVSPGRQRRGIGSKLINAALNEMRRFGGQGCVVLGDPAYYGRLGFKPYPMLVLPGTPPEYFQALSFGKDMPAGSVSYHQSFETTK